MALFSDYALLSLPDLSCLRRPPTSRQNISVDLISPCSETILLLALARCLGAYCASADVLLAWQPQYTSGVPSSVTAARITWHSYPTWNDVLENISFIECADSTSQAISLSLGIHLDPGQSPFLAALSQNESYDLPLVLSIPQPSTLLITYSSQFFHPSTATQLAEQIRHLAHHISTNQFSSPKDLSFIPKALQSSVPLVSSQDTSIGCAYTHIPEARFVSEFIPRHSSSLPALEFYPDLYLHDSDTSAILNSVQRLTYGELHTRSNAFAAYLTAQGLQNEDRVALCMHRGPEFLIAMLGILKAGGCYVPIDAELPEERRNFIAHDSNAKFVYTLPTLRPALRESASYPSIDINNARPEGLAYLLYTSGTTGTPKGCLLTHDGLAQAIMALSSFNMEAGEGKRQWERARYLAIASVAFDVHLSETFATLAIGGTVVSAPRSQLLEDLPRWIKVFGITHLGLVPSLIEATLNAMEDEAKQGNESEGDGQERGVMDLAFIAAGGEKMSDSILSKWADHPLVTLANFYGPSEVTIGCSARLMSGNTRKESVGRIFKNCSAYVLDENLDLVIRGGVGELVVGGRLVGRGYHGRPDLTEKAFITYNEERVYRTGDLVRLMPDETIEILGRIDTQIKLRGVRIESEGVSSVVRNAALSFFSDSPRNSVSKDKPKVDVSTILARHPQIQADQLVTFIAWDTSVTIQHRRTSQPNVLPPRDVPQGLMQAISKACARELASYMRPAHIVPLNFLPLNPNGKTDGKALGAVFCKESLDVLGRAAASDARKEEASDVLERKGEAEKDRPFEEKDFPILDLITRHANVKREGLKWFSNLFQLGFDSLKFVKLAGELRRIVSTGKDSSESFNVSVSELMQNPTVGGIVSLVQRYSNIEFHERTSGDRKRGVKYVSDFAIRWREEVEDVYETPSSLSSSIYEAQRTERVQNTSYGVIERILPTFPVQDGVLYRSADLATLYVQHVVLELQRDIDISKMKEAWRKVVRRCEILRTVFHFSSEVVQVVLDAEAQQCVLPWEVRPLPLIINDNEFSDFSAREPSIENSFSKHFINGDALEFARSINDNISSRPAFRLALYQNDSGNGSVSRGESKTEHRGRRYLTLSIHHAIYDGISLPLLLKDVETQYLKEASDCGETQLEIVGAPLERALTMVYDVDPDEAAQFWRKTFDGFDWSKIPHRLSNGEDCAQIRSITMNLGLSEWEMRAAGRSVSVQAIFTAAFGVCLGENMYGIQDVVFGVIRSGRSFADEEVNNVRAPLLNVLPARVKADGSTDVLRSVQNDIGSVLAYESIPLMRVQTWLQPGRPLFEVLFSISIDDYHEDTRVWKIEKSVQPQADYILAVEVVIDKKDGKVRVDGAFTDPLSQEFVDILLKAIESTAVALVDGTHTISKALQSQDTWGSHRRGTDSGDGISDEPGSIEPVDPELEEKIRKIVSKFLRIGEDQVTKTASLIALGLDSIKSVGLARMMRAEGVKISALEIMRRPSVRGIAAAASVATGTTSGKKEADSNDEIEKGLLKEKRREIERVVDLRAFKLCEADQIDVFPTTTLQAGMLSQTVSSGGHLYIHGFPFTLVPDIDICRLKKAWEGAIKYFNTLRTSFHYVEELGSWIQIVHTLSVMKWSEEKIQLADNGSLTQRIEKYITELDYSSETKFLEPPMHLRLYSRKRTSDDLESSHQSSLTLVLVLHHALYDGISISRLQEVVEKLYKGETLEPEPQFTDLLGYFEYQERFGTEFWIRQLTGLERPSLPQHGREGSSTSKATSIAEGGNDGSLVAPTPSISITATCTLALDRQRMSDATRLFDVTVQCFGQAVLAKVLARLYNRRDVVFGHVVSGRNVKNAENVLGPVISTIPCRTKIGKDAKNIDLVRAIHKQNTAAHNWQHASLREIQRKLGLSSLWDAIYVFQPIMEEDKHELWSFDDSEDEIAKIQYPLNIEVHQKEDEFEIMAACQGSYFTAETADNLIKEFRDGFMEIIEDPSGPAIPYLPIDDKPVEDGGNNDISDSRNLKSSSDQTLLVESDSRLSVFMDIIAESTKVPREHIHPNTPLVSLGVDSISAIQISARARAGGIKLRAADVLYCDIPLDVLKFLKNNNKYIKDARGDSEPADGNERKEVEGYRVDPALKTALLQRLDAAPEDVEGVYPATAGMKWLVGMWQLSNRSRFQHVFVFQLSEDVLKERMSKAWDKLIQRHAILRSTFASTDSKNLYIITFKNGASKRSLSLKTLVPEEQDVHKSIADIAKDVVSHPLSTEFPPLQSIYSEINNEKYLILHLHHFQYDAWSMRLLLDDFARLYRDEEPSNRGHLSQLLYACNTLSREEQRQYWETYLTKSSSLSLLPRPQKVVDKKQRERALSLITLKKKARRLSSSISNIFSTRQGKPSSSLTTPTKEGYKRLLYFDENAVLDLVDLRQRAHNISVSLNAVFLACWARVQAHYSKSNSATFGLWHLGRTGVIDDVDSLAVPSMNVLPIHVTSVNSTLQELASQVQTTLRQRSAVVEQSHLDDVYQWVGGGNQTLLNVFVNIVGKTDLNDDSCGDDVLLRPVNIPYFIPDVGDAEAKPTAEKLAICSIMEEAALVDIVERGQNVGISIEYSSEYLDANTCRELVTEWSQLVEASLDRTTEKR